MFVYVVFVKHPCDWLLLLAAFIKTVTILDPGACPEVCFRVTIPAILFGEGTHLRALKLILDIVECYLLSGLTRNVPHKSKWSLTRYKLGFLQGRMTWQLPRMLTMFLFSQKLTVSRFMGPGITRPTSESGQVKPAEHRVCRVEGSWCIFAYCGLDYAVVNFIYSWYLLVSTCRLIRPDVAVEK